MMSIRWNYRRLRNVLTSHLLFVLFQLLLIFHSFLLSCFYTHGGGEHLIVLVEHVFGSLNLIMNWYLLAQYLITNLSHHVAIWINDHFLWAAHASTIIMEMNRSKEFLPSIVDVCLGTVVSCSEAKLGLILFVLLLSRAYSRARMTAQAIDTVFLIHEASSLRSVLRYADLTPTVYVLYDVRGLWPILYIWYLSRSLATSLSYSLNSSNNLILLLISLHNLLLLVVWLLTLLVI